MDIFEEVLKQKKLEKKNLDVECKRNIRDKVAEAILEKCLLVGRKLEVSDTQLTEIRIRCDSRPTLQTAVDVLDAWADQKGETATCLVLGKVLSAIPNRRALEILCNEVAPSKPVETTPEDHPDPSNEDTPNEGATESCSDITGSTSIAKIPTSPVQKWKLKQLHALGNTGKGTTIAILDGGFDRNHLSLRKGDSINGYNFLPGMNSCVHPNEWSGITAGNYHGTAVAAIAAGISFIDFPGGVAPDAKLYVCRVLESSACKIHEGLKHIRDNVKTYGIDIVCMSFKMHAGKDENIESLLADLNKLGVVCVAAAGNDGDYQPSVGFPASDPNVLSVGALRPLGQKSDLNPSDVAGIDVYAPGEDIIVPGLPTKISVDICDGTSFSAPMVAGFLSLLIQYANDTKNPRIIAKYHDVKFLKQLFNNRNLCEDRKLLQVFDFLNEIYRRKELLVTLIQKVYGTFTL